jgi:hypothetical protein
MDVMRKSLAVICLLAPAGASAGQWSTDGGAACVPLRNAEAAKLWVIYDEQKTAIETSQKSAPGPDFNFGVELKADRRVANCLRIRWRVEPWGAHPANAADFGGRFPAGTLDLTYNSHHGEMAGAVQIWAIDDHRREGPETFRIVLLDPITRKALAGSVGMYDPNTGLRARNVARRLLSMQKRLVMTIVDAGEPGASS